METFGTLENWSLRRGGRLREVFATRGSTVFMLHPHSLSSIENQASSSSYLVDESKDDGNGRDLMQSAFSLNYSSNSGIGFICRCTSLSFLSRLAPIWLFKSYTTHEHVKDTCVHVH